MTTGSRRYLVTVLDQTTGHLLASSHFFVTAVSGKGNVLLTQHLLMKSISDVHALSRITQFYLHIYLFMHKCNEPYLILPFQPKLGLIY